MSNRKATNSKKTDSKDKWKSTGGALQPVDLTKVKLVNTPKKTK